MTASTVSLLPKNHVATKIDIRDAKSPDSWVPRNPELVRLTGKHPLNAEPPLSKLVDQGFITPISVHFIRNHGKVALTNWESHRLTIKGLVATELCFSMNELIKLPSVTMPVSLTCSGNRRKEINMTKQTVGFNYGAGATACTMYKGVRLTTLLNMAGIDMQRAKHISFEATDKEELPTGSYGTSIDVATAMNPYGDVLVAYEANGVRLKPDHGFPVRLIIPGWIAGRMVKYLSTIEVREKPSEHYYHFFDNRVFPPHVDAELAHEQGLWFQDEYFFNEMNINSAIAHPANGERLVVTDSGTYNIKGYAYSGGGRKVGRVEISLDCGETWLNCKTSYPEEQHSHAPSTGKYYCWMFWELEIHHEDLYKACLSSGQFQCRAWDSSNNTQPKEGTWNLMGMANNRHFTIKMNAVETSNGTVIDFQHPTVPGPAEGGWMMSTSPSKSAAPVPANSGSGTKKPKSSRKFTLEEVKKNNSEQSAWIIVDGKVYDTTSYLDEHPGGVNAIVMGAGEDVSEEFNAIHSTRATKMLEKYYIGDVEDDTEYLDASSVSDLSKTEFDEVTEATLTLVDEDKVALDPKKWTEFELIEKIEISHDTRLLKFKLQSPEHRLGLPVGHHLFAKAVVDGKMVMRAYTPVSSDDDLGHFTLCVKVYFADVHPKFPDGGKMSQYMEKMQIGDMLNVKGPLGHFEYKGRGNFTVKGKDKHASKIGLICGGTGLTPAYQVIQAIYRDPEDKTEVHLLYANQTDKDILMRKELEKMAAERENIHLWYTVGRFGPKWKQKYWKAMQRWSAPIPGWKYSLGRVNESMIRKRLPEPGADTFVGMCGPPQMVHLTCVPALKAIGFAEDNFTEF